jgi:excisionase family DNA binding protein
VDQEPIRQTYTIAESAKRIGISRNAAYEAAKRGEIPSIRIGRRVVVPAAALEKKLRGDAA